MGVTLFEALFEAHSISLSQKKNLDFRPKVPKNRVFELQLSRFFLIFDHFWAFESKFKKLQTYGRKSVLMYLLGTSSAITYCHMATSRLAVLQILHF